MEVREESLTKVEVTFPQADQSLFVDFNISHVTMTESLMSPSLQTKIHAQSYRHPGYIKNWDKLAYQKVKIKAWRDILKDIGQNHELIVENTTFRVSSRTARSDQIDSLDIMAIDDDALSNAKKRMSKSWKCTTPSEIVSDVLNGCVKVQTKPFLEQSTPARTFFAENIHPYQVIAQQADVALANQNDPSFLHFITYENILGKQHFESLYKMTRKKETWAYDYNERGDLESTWENPYAILAYTYPCDYDLLSDEMNGAGNQSLMAINPFSGAHSILGGSNSGCGMGGQETDTAFTNKGSAAAEGNCEIDVEKHKLTRTARLGLLDQDKVAMRVTVAFNPNLHVGQMVKLTTYNKQSTSKGELYLQPDYASGYYLISALTHRLVNGGFGTTVLDCISKSVGTNGRTWGA
jgi:hypothetical protein